MSAGPSRQDCFERLWTRWNTLGLEQLTDKEQDAVALFWLEGEVLNGGFLQYFGNSSGDGAPRALLALDRLGAKLTHQRLTSAMTLLCGSQYCVDRVQRNALLDRFDGQADPFGPLTDALQAEEEDFLGLALEQLRPEYR